MNVKIKEFVDKIRKEISAIDENISDDEILNYIKGRVFNEDSFRILPLDKIHNIVNRTYNALKSDMSVLNEYINDNRVSEIMVNGPDNIFIEKDGKLKKIDESFFDTEELEEVIRRIAGSVHREINEMVPIVDARLSNGSRVNAVYKNIALGGPILTIRKFPEHTIEMEDLIAGNTITIEAAEFLKKLLKAGYNFFISGGTSSGKTTFLSALSSYISKEERVIVIEDSIELTIKSIPNIVRMECKVGGGNQTVSDIGIDKLIKTSLRMRPDKIIIGEIRDGNALVNMLNGLNTGHSGLCTGHSNSVTGMIRRMEALYMQTASFPIEAIDEQIAEGINIIVHLAKLKNSRRCVIEISELYIKDNGRIGVNKLFKYSDGKLVKTDNCLINDEKLLLNEM